MIKYISIMAFLFSLIYLIDVQVSDCHKWATGDREIFCVDRALLIELNLSNFNYTIASL